MIFEEMLREEKQEGRLEGRIEKGNWKQNRNPF